MIQLNLLVATCLLCLSTAAIAQKPQSGDAIPPQALNKALEEFANRSGLQIVYVSELVQGKASSGSKPNLSDTETLDALLSSTGLEYEYLNTDTVTLYESQEVRTDEPGAGSSSNPVLLAQASESAKTQGQRSTNSQSRQQRNDLDGDHSSKEQEVPEIVVVGSYIRGVVPESSPTMTFNREDIEASNSLTVPEFLATIPQNHTGGATEFTYQSEASEGTATNAAGGVGVNLRGLGSSATLILVNGRRIVPTGTGSFVDISMIPLHLVKRVEVLTDGASSLYGSDAIGGVVNLVLRDDFDGAETVLQYGTVTSGDVDQIQLSQLFGKNWGSGHASISYEYYDRGALDANDRAFSSDARDPYQLMPDQSRHSAFFSIDQDLNDRIGVFAEGIYSRRDTQLDWYEFQTVSFSSDAETKQQNLSIGARVELMADWRSELVATVGNNENKVRSFTRDVSGNLSELAGAQSDFDIMVFDFKVDGPLAELPGGNTVKLALGGQYQDVEFDTAPLIAGSRTPFESSRDISAGFYEVFLPVVSSENRRRGLERLELSVSGRYEDYSDFGSEFTNKVGLLWAPTDGLKLRGTWGESYRAPILVDKSNNSVQGFLVDNTFLANFPDPFVPADLDIPLTLVAFGSNPDLEAETATTWTAGFDYVPGKWPGVTLNVTYFEVDYKDRIEDVFPPHFLQPFFDDTWSSLISLNPDPDFMVFLMSQPFSFNLTESGDPADTVAFVDERKQNFSSVKTTGLDFNLAYETSMAGYDWGFSLNAAYIFDSDKQLLETLPPFSLLNTTYNPVDLKLRGRMSWSWERVTANLFANYTDDYIDDRTLGFQGAPPRKVASWTTFDASVSYRPASRSFWSDGTSISLNVTNMFDRDPPFVFQPRTFVNYDPANANPLGRFISLSLRKQW